jgi:aminoglycoside phosphotransferase (APT) family kinase protein
MGLLRDAGTGVRVPDVVAVCEDPAVLGVPFYLMAKVEGDVVRDTMPAWLTEGRRRDVGFDVVHALAEIHSAPYQPFVDSGIGRPSGYLERQVRRWRGQREGMLAAGGGRDLPDYDAVSAWLGDHLPQDAGDPAVVHGDYKLDNVILDGSTGRVAAVVDTRCWASRSSKCGISISPRSRAWTGWTRASTAPSVPSRSLIAAANASPSMPSACIQPPMVSASELVSTPP